MERTKCVYSLNCTGYSLLSAFVDLVSMAQTVIASTKHIGLNRAEIEQQKDILVAVDRHGVCRLSHSLYVMVSWFDGNVCGH